MESSPKTLKKRVAVSVIAQLASQLLIGALGVVVLKIMTNDLGAASYGTYVTILAFVSTFSLLTDLGLNAVTTREIAKRPQDAQEIISHNMGLRLFLCLAIVPVISGLGFVFYPQATTELRLGILLMSCYLFFNAIWAVSSTYFASKVRNDIPAFVTSLQQVLFTGGVAIVAIIGWGLFGFITAYISTIAFCAVLLFWRVRSNLAIRPRVNIQAWRTVLRMSISVGLIAIIHAMYLKADSIMLSVMSGATAVGVYGVAYALLNIFSSLPGYLMGALTPSLATVSEEEFKQIVQKAFHFMMVLAGILTVGAFIIKDDAVLLVSSPEFAAAAMPFAILTLAIACSYVGSIFSYASIAVSKHHKFVYLSLGTLLLNISINFAFIPRFGIVGAAWATVISEFVAMTIGYWLFRRQTRVALDMSVILKPAFAAAVSLAVGIGFYGRMDTGSPLLNCIVGAVLLGVPYFAVVYALKGLPEEMRLPVGWLARLFKR